MYVPINYLQGTYVCTCNVIISSIYVLYSLFVLTVIQGPSSIIYIPGVIPLPIELICKVSGQPAWQVNDTEYSLEILERGNLEGHNRNKTNILVNTPVNNTKYVCVSKTADGDIFFSQPAFLFIGGEYPIQIRRHRYIRTYEHICMFMHMHSPLGVMCIY